MVSVCSIAHKFPWIHMNTCISILYSDDNVVCEKISICYKILQHVLATINDIFHGFLGREIGRQVGRQVHVDFFSLYRNSIASFFSIIDLLLQVVISLCCFGLGVLFFHKLYSHQKEDAVLDKWYSFINCMIYFKVLSECQHIWNYVPLIVD